MSTKFLFALSVTAALCANADAPLTAGSRTPATFVGDFERGDFSNWDTRQGAQADSLQIVTDVVRRGRYAAKFTVRPGEIVSNGNRAEITHDHADHPGSKRWYAWSFFVPSDFQDTEWQPKLWQCIGQWHDQPDPRLGETWKTFPGHSPSIALYYTSKNGVPAIELWHGPKKDQDIVAVAPIRKGEWMDVVFHIGWSPGADGYVEAWLNGNPLIAPEGDQHKVFGPNMWNSYSHFLKIGLYRSSRFTTTNSIYYDEVRVGNSQEEVALKPSEAPKAQ